MKAHLPLNLGLAVIAKNINSKKSTLSLVPIVALDLLVLVGISMQLLLHLEAAPKSMIVLKTYKFPLHPILDAVGVLSIKASTLHTKVLVLQLRVRFLL